MLRTDAKKLETRDFISVGIFSLIYAVVAFVIGGVAQMTPVTFPFMPMIVALFMLTGVEDFSNWDSGLIKKQP